MADKPRILVAGFGNVLRGDDGFGVEVIRHLSKSGMASSDVMLLDVGIGGIRLAQELLAGYERLIVVDAMARGGTPGTLYVLAVDAVEAAGEVDMHLTVPSRALAVAKMLDAIPPEVYMVGCEPGEVDELVMTLTPPVARAVGAAAQHVRELASRPINNQTDSAQGAPHA